jgi:hypothetical protein
MKNKLISVKARRPKFLISQIHPGKKEYGMVEGEGPTF